MTEPPPPTYTITVRPRPGVDAVRALRALLKLASRHLGLVCTLVEPARSPDQASSPREAP